MSYNDLSDGALVAWLTNFATVSAANAVTLGIDLPDQLEIDNALADFSAAYNAKVAAASSALTATSDKDIERDISLGVVGKFNAEWQANPAISSTLIGDLGLTIHSETRSVIGVFTPLGFEASGEGNGNVTMKWQRNGNKWGCTFLVEDSTDNGLTWSLKTATTRARITLIGVTIQPTIYRVRAERNGAISGASSQSLVYGPTVPVEGTPLSLAA